MKNEYTEMLKEISGYIIHLEKTLSNYENKLIDMELEDMLEPKKEYPGKSIYYYNRLEKHHIGLRNDGNLTGEGEIPSKEWAYSKTEGSNDKARSEALAKAKLRSEIELREIELDREDKM